MEKKAAMQIKNKSNLGLLFIKEETPRMKGLMGEKDKRVIPPNSSLMRCATAVPEIPLSVPLKSVSMNKELS